MKPLNYNNKTWEKKPFFFQTRRMMGVPFPTNINSRAQKDHSRTKLLLK